MLVAVRRMLPAAEQYSLEIPSAPLPEANILPQSSRMLRARAVRLVHAKDCHLMGLKFSRALST